MKIGGKRINLPPAHRLTTWLIVGCCLAALVALVGGERNALAKATMFDFSLGFSQPWGVLTYFFSPASGLGAAISALFLWSFGMSLEARWGIRKYAWSVVGLTVASALAMSAGSWLVNKNVVLESAVLPCAALVVAWSRVFPSARVLLMMCLPTPAWFAALIASMFALGVTMGNNFGILPMALLPLLLGYGLGAGWLEKGVEKRTKPMFKGRGEEDYLGSNREKRIQDELERVRLKQLLERSFNDKDAPDS